MHNLSDEHVKSASSIYLQLDVFFLAAGFSSVLQLTNPCPSIPLLQASMTTQITAPTLLLLLK
jgi:hypothetical protein